MCSLAMVVAEEEAETIVDVAEVDTMVGTTRPTSPDNSLGSRRNKKMGSRRSHKRHQLLARRKNERPILWA